MTLQISGLDTLLLIFARVGGMFFFNPVLSRRNIPSRVRAGLVFAISVVLSYTVAPASAAGQLPYLLQLIQELFVGFAAGILFSFYFYLVFMAGDIIDNAFGLAMAKTFDPGTNIQSSVSSTLFQFLFYIYFFITNSHLIFIQLTASSFELIPPGGSIRMENILEFLLTVFVSAFNLAMHLVLPYLAASFVLEISMGILMKLIPQISVFSIHFQVKILVGFSLLFLFAAPVTRFMQNYETEMLAQIQNLFVAAAG